MQSVPPASAPARLLSYTALIHGAYYVLTGFWPLVSIGTFQLVTGPKRDLWLVRTAGALIGVIGCVLAMAGWRRRITPEIPLLAAGSAVSLAAIDVVYVRRRVILPLYLADALAEIGLAMLWAFGWVYRRQKAPATGSEGLAP